MGNTAKKRNYEIISQRITERILDGEYKIGDRIPAEAELVAEFGVGRSSVREAVKSLQIQGILESTPGRGTFVTAEALICISNGHVSDSVLQPDSLGNILEARMALEQEIAWLAAMRRTDEDIEELQGTVDKLNQAEKTGALVSGSTGFHKLLSRATRNPVLIDLYNSILESFYQIRLARTVSMISQHRQGNSEHQAILDAVKNRDPEEARRLMFTHMINSYPDYLGCREKNE